MEIRYSGINMKDLGFLMITNLGSLSNEDSDGKGNGNGKKAIGLH